eukprot:g6533.t1
MPGKELVDHNGISAAFDDEEKTETRRPHDKKSSREVCLDGGAIEEEATPRTAVQTPRISSCTEAHDGDDPPSTPAPSTGAPSSRSPKKGGRKSLSSYVGRVTKGLRRRFFDVDSSPGLAKERSVAEAGGSTPRSAGRTVKGRKHEDKANEDRFFVHDDILARGALPPSPSSQPLPAVGGAAAAGGGAAAAGGPAGGAEAEQGLARVSAIVGKVGLYGAFDGHGGSGRCASIVSQHLPHGVKNSPAWARLAAVGDHEDMIITEGETTTRPQDRPVAQRGGGGGGAREEGARDDGGGDGSGGDGGGGALDHLVVGVMKEAILDGFRSAQETFALRSHPYHSSGSTATVAIVCGRHVVIANLGDSGGLFHNDQDTLGRGPLTAKTEFHNASNERERKRVEAAGGYFKGVRLFDTLQPTRSFGNQDLRRKKEGVLIAEPELTVYTVRPTNGVAFLVLGSDGLWDGVPEDSKVIDIVREEEDLPRSRSKPGKVPLRIAKALVGKAAQKSPDDITAVVILFHKH